MINILYTFRNLAGLELELLGTAPCFAGQTSLIRLKANSHKGNKEAIYIGWKHADLALLNLTANQSAEIHLSYPAPKRGYLKPPRLDLFTRYPTGLSIAWAYAALDITAIVYPKPEELFAQKAPAQSKDEAENGVVLSGGANDFAGLRQYQTGDPLRQIHWAKYAQTGKLYSKVFVDYASNDLWLDWEHCFRGSIEQRLSHLCAQILAFHQEQKTYGLRLPHQTITPNNGEAHHHACLTALAVFPSTI